MKWLKKTAFIIVSSILVFSLQSAVFPHISFGQVVPNLLVIVTAAFGLMDGVWYGMMAGVFCGLLQDVFFGDFIGFYTMIYMLIGYVNGKLNNIFYPEDIKLPLLSAMGSDLVYGIICYVILFLLRRRLNVSFYFMKVILPEVIYTIIATMVIYPLILIFHRLMDGEIRRDRGFE